MSHDDPGDAGYVIAAVTDLFFTTRLRASANDLGVSLDFAATAEEVLDRVRREEPRLVVVDLEADGFDPVDLVAALRRQAGPDELRIVAFLSHVHTEKKRAAEEAGCDEVLPRSAFVRNLAEILGAVDLPR